MEYVSLDSMPYYKECAPLVEGLGYRLVELKVGPAKGTVRITAVIAAKDASVDIGVDDCSKVHHALLPRLEALLGTDDTYMELTSPGMERNIKNAAEFAVFIGREVRVWDKTVTDWVGGKILSADDKTVTLEKDGESLVFPFENIAKAKFIHL
ncbi:MAG: ribosome maturation factor RimP [Treponema sp.]|nr:ribosome maturation factor RimP [Treponema sp.]